ncbi:MAG: plasmid pRiA4b ORF-3 family protein [Bacteroidales bacterium]|nr:plasmid pRiA4b ORF-3 family protein [Bacteroidales bacterium]
MAKRKTSAITPEQESEAQRIIDNMTPKELEQMAAFEQEFSKMPEEMQDAMFEFVQQLQRMPAKKREELYEAFNKLYPLQDGAGDSTDFDGDDEDEEWDDEDNFEDADYPHFLLDDEVLKYTLRITLRRLKPAIYRKFIVPSNISLRHLSELLIELMGWSGDHLNQFRNGNDYYAPAYQRENEMPVFFGPARNHDQEDIKLSDILYDKGKTIEWEYDFGDSWRHDVRLSSIGEYAEGEPLVSFVKGERACPPEDCGGIWGYEELLELHAKRQAHKRLSREEKDRLEWHDMVDDFDPEDYDTDLAREICEEFCE